MGFFRSLEEACQADHLWAWSEYTGDAYDATLASDGLTGDPEGFGASRPARRPPLPTQYAPPAALQPANQARCALRLTLRPPNLTAFATCAALEHPSLPVRGWITTIGWRRPRPGSPHSALKQPTHRTSEGRLPPSDNQSRRAEARTPCSDRRTCQLEVEILDLWQWNAGV